MNEKIAEEILDELFSSLEALETQSTAILQFLKDKGIAREEELVPYFEQAGNTSSVRWRAARVRIEHLLSSAMKAADREEKKNKQEPPPNTGEETSRTQKAEKDVGDTQQGPASGGAEAENVNAKAGVTQPLSS